VKNIKIVIEYNGTGFSGWQSQKNGLTIQDIIEQSLLKITGENIRISGSGRTDAGVHAFGQVASFKTGSSIPPEKFAYALNQKLPEGIVIVGSEKVPEDFHARFSAKSKEYIYKIYNSKFPSAIYNNLLFQTPLNLNIDLMNRGCEHLIGVHDFKSFMSSGSNAESTVREVFYAACTKCENIITFTISGNGFLYNMVRIIVGTLIQMGNEKIDPDEMINIILSQDRELAAPTAPAHGLYLNKVTY
jgi:tRNA pseudouridine38-40 synthase